jgi:endonuclease/exonuclease/phosphatase (EEP) superfamily protein YafD
VLFLVVACVGPWMRASTPSPRQPISIVAANLMTSNTSTGAASDVLAEKADVVVTVETNGRSYTTLVRELGPPSAFGGSAESCSIGKGTCSSVNVWSRFPARVAGNQRVLRAVRGIRVRIDAPSGPFVLYAVHAPAPVPFRSGGGKADPTDQRHRLDALLDAATAERLPVVIAGDLNMPDRTSAYRAFADRMRDAVRSSFATPTSLKWYQAALLLRIDHVFVSKAWCADHGYAFSLGGSDHRGVGADVGECPAPRSGSGSERRHAGA